MRKFDEGCMYCGEMDRPTEPFELPGELIGCKVFAFRCARCKEAEDQRIYGDPDVPEPRGVIDATSSQDATTDGRTG